MSDQRILDEVQRCRKEFVYFAQKYLYVTDRDTRKRVPLRFKPAQKMVLRDFAEFGTTYALKTRRLGITVAIMARLFHRVHFSPNMAAVTVAQDGPAAVEMFKTVREWYEGLPEFLKIGPFATRTNRDDQLYYKHGGSYRVGSADSKALVGGATLVYRHYSEFAKYGDSAEDIIAYVEGGSGRGGRAIYETTAEGLGYAYRQWETETGWKKRFLPFTLDRGYRMRVEHLPPGQTEDMALTPEVLKFAEHHGLDDAVRLWVGSKLIEQGQNWRKFNQEFPITADVAWTVSRGRVLRDRYVFHPSWRLPLGPISYHEPMPYRAYVMGVDPAEGNEDGDFSAWCVLDVTNRDQPVIMSTFYDRISTPDFADLVYKEAVKYGALVNVERNRGLDVINRLQEDGYGFIWREIKPEKVGNKVVEKLGWYTSGQNRPMLVNSLIEFIDGRKLTLTDERAKFEANTFMWNPEKTDRAEHAPGAHDDMLFAIALALVGRDQVQAQEEHKRLIRPVTLAERVAYRSSTGKSHTLETFDDDFDFEDAWEALPSMHDFLQKMRG